MRCRRINEDWIGEIPNHWDVRRIKRVVSQVDYGISESSEQDSDFDSENVELQSGEIVFSKIEFVEEVFENLLLERAICSTTEQTAQTKSARQLSFVGAEQMELHLHLTGHVCEQTIAPIP